MDQQAAKKPRKHRNQNRGGESGTPAEKKADQLLLVKSAAKATVQLLAKAGLPCAVFGSLACLLYGNARNPKDADIIVLPPANDTRLAEEIKLLLVTTNPTNFYLKAARDPAATYRILWYRTFGGGPTCKVDILTPGIIHLPYLDPTTHVLWSDEIPICPFSLLLLHKLQAWDDHRKSTEKHKNVKQQQDAADVKRLLLLETYVAELEGLGAFPWGDEALFSDEFQSLSKERVINYCTAFPARVTEWKRLGFQVERLMI